MYKLRASESPAQLIRISYGVSFLFVTVWLVSGVFLGVAFVVVLLVGCFSAGGCLGLSWGRLRWLAG